MMGFTREILRRVHMPFVVLTPYQAKGGRRLPADLPVVVDAGYTYPGDNDGKDRIKLMKWMHLYVTLATYERLPYAKVFIAWQNGTLEEIDLATCPRYPYPGEKGWEA